MKQTFIVIMALLSFLGWPRTAKASLIQKVAPKEKADNSQMETIYHQLEERMKSVIGSKVAIHSRNYKKGKIEIEYYSNEELERIIDLIESINR